MILLSIFRSDPPVHSWYRYYWNRCSCFSVDSQHSYLRGVGSDLGPDPDNFHFVRCSILATYSIWGTMNSRYRHIRRTDNYKMNQSSCAFLFEPLLVNFIDLWREMPWEAPGDSFHLDSKSSLILQLNVIWFSYYPWCGRKHKNYVATIESDIFPIYLGFM
jgi:hypothetical protein